KFRNRGCVDECCFWPSCAALVLKPDLFPLSLWQIKWIFNEHDFLVQRQKTMSKPSLGAKGYLAVCGMMACAWTCFGEPWPRFRGPNGAGISGDRDVPVQWTGKDNLLWQTKIPGAGNSSPIVWEDRVFLESASADGKDRS